MQKMICIAMVFFLAGSAAAQISIPGNFGSAEGVCQSHVFSLCEEKRGFLWIGTYNGVSRWDGMGFLTFDRSSGLAGNQVTVLYEGRDSTIYIGTDEGLSASRHGRLCSLPAAALVDGERIQAIHQGEDGALFIGTTRRGVIIFRPDGVDSLNRQSGLPSDAITGFAETEADGLIIGTTRGGCRYQGGRLEALPGLAGITVSRFCPLTGGGLALATAEQGLLILHNGRLSEVPGSDQLGSARISALAEDRDGGLCCGTFGRGVLILKNGLVRKLTEENGLAHDNVFVLVAGRGGPLYIGTVAGLSIYRQGVLSVYNEEVGIARNFVTSICEGRDGALYFGTFGGGVTRMKNRQYDHLTRREGLAGGMVYCVREIDGALYCGTTEGLSIMRDGRFESFRNGQDGQPLRIRSVLQMPGGDILLADGSGLCQLLDGRVELLSRIDGHHLLAMDRDRNGRLYLATSKGAFTWQEGRLDPVDGLPRTTILTVRCLRDGRICYGTDIGLFIQEGSSLCRITVGEGLLHNSIADILEDPAGRIFLLTMRGVNILDSSLQQTTIRALQHSDGLASDECSANSGWVDRRGRIWIGSVRGATCYDPALDRPNTIPPLMHIERMRLFDRELALEERTGDAQFAHDQNYFRFDFIGINLRAPDKVRYRYRMAGIDAGWVETRERFVQYTSLDDGPYAFEVKGCNEWGIWSEPARVHFMIHPAFWERGWFLALVSLLAAGTTAFLATHRIRRLLSIERLRAHIAADLHDSIGSGLTEIAILSEAAGQKGAGFKEQVASALDKISGISRELVDSMSDIVWLVNPQRDSLYDLLVRIKDTYDDVTAAAGIALQTGNLQQLEKLHLPMIYRQNLYLIVKEAFTNALKHSKCLQISLQAGVHRGNLSLVIADNGVGFDAVHERHGNGLASMKRRAQILGGTLTVDSKPGAGTHISFEGRIGGVSMRATGYDYRRYRRRQ